MNVCAIVLTYNEELHLRRCIKALDFCRRIYVVDSLSTDRTVAIALESGACVLQNPWKNYATQFNWALSQVPEEFDWVLRIDADEIVSLSLRDEIVNKLSVLDQSVSGVYVPRRMNFLGQPIRYGGIFPVLMLRIFRRGKGYCENRWMDEHIKVSGETTVFYGELLDDNLNTLTWWTEKHNKYACREVVDILNAKYGFIPHDSVASLDPKRQDALKRWVKENIYSRFPTGLRAVVYFLYRYILRLGFLDGKAGSAFHVLQGFWYRYLVDAKLEETSRYMKTHNVEAREAIRAVLGISL